MKFASMAALLVVITVSQLQAGEGKEATYDALSLQGKVVQQENEMLDKSGEIKMVQTYYLQTSATKIELPVHRNCQGEVTVNLAPFVDQVVTVHARGLRKVRDGKTFVYIAKLESVRKVQSETDSNAFIPAST